MNLGYHLRWCFPRCAETHNKRVTIVSFCSAFFQKVSSDVKTDYCAYHRYQMHPVPNLGKATLN
ncbi:hypothetical protein GLYMA_17G179300v4 [Glycine max]|uniref:Uncharacterized protein n=2 Tax=Glycine subgen. Soja TaxID=1462606 RepID=A0A0R0FEY4_SOYBN|nr:hypothetical protein GYH30_047655 [Glycine max]KRH04689.1 hypothetical protein GLYMA_17G179300v4 [Glycine max]RZB57410.1 hypothetical protein D0Y65_046181 [Glycine soja]